MTVTGNLQTIQAIDIFVEINVREMLMPRLTEREQQEIIRYIEADKPLPDKYRFLLFEDKREVELVWNGKTNEEIRPGDGPIKGRSGSGDQAHQGEIRA
jgi:hypothetical protein